MNNPETGVELDRALVEFENWHEAGGKRDLEQFIQERGLKSDIATGLRDIIILEQRVAGLVSGATGLESGEAGMPSESPGNVGDRYQFVRKLGVGGMGTVWLAEQQEPVQRQVAIKLIRRELDSERFVKRFEAERQALAMMTHPNVAKVLDAGTADNEEPYFVMEYVPGMPINEYCNENRCSLNQRLELFLQLCDGILHAHQKGLLHRDIKPTNVLVSEIDDKPQVKIIDFGLAKILSDEPRTESHLTNAETALGSPLWMSPEQAGGNQRSNPVNVDTRSDIYSLGVVLYQLLTNSTPITNEFYNHATLSELFEAIREQDPPYPSARLAQLHRSSEWVTDQTNSSFATWNSLLRNDLDWIVMKALEKERDRRYPTVAAMADDVRRFINSEPVVARPPSFVYRMKKLVRRNRIAVLSSAFIILSLLITSVVSSGLTIWALSEKETARLERLRADRQRIRAEYVSKFSERGFELLNVSNPHIEYDKYKEEFLLSRIDVIDALDISHDPLTEADLRRLLADALSGLGKPELAVIQFERVVEICERAYGLNHPATIDAKISVAYEFLELWNPEKARRLAEECLTAANQEFGPDHELSITSGILLNSVFLQQGKIDLVADALEDLVRRVEENLGQDHPAFIGVTAAMADAFYKKMEYRESARWYDRARMAAAKQWGRDHRRTMDLEIHYWDASIRSVQSGKTREELTAFIDRVIRKFGEQHVFSLRLRYLHGHILFQQREKETAVTVFASLIDDCQKYLGSDHMLTAKAKMRLGDGFFWSAYRDSDPKASGGDYAESLTLTTTVLPIFAKTPGTHSPEFIHANYRIGEIYFRTGRRRDALKIAKKYGPLAIQHLGYASKTSNRLADLEARCYAELGDISKAMGVFEKMLSTGRQLHGGDTNQTAIWLLRLAEGYFRIGNDERLIDHLKKALAVYAECQGMNGQDTHGVLMGLHINQIRLEDFVAAENYARQSLNNLVPQMPLFQKLKQSAQTSLAEAMAGQGKFAEARTIANEVLATDYEKGNRVAENARAKGVLATCQIHDGKYEAAENLLKEAIAIQVPANLDPMTDWYPARCHAHFVSLYEAWDKPGLAAKHKKLVDQYSR